MSQLLTPGLRTLYFPALPGSYMPDRANVEHAHSGAEGRLAVAEYVIGKTQAGPGKNGRLVDKAPGVSAIPGENSAVRRIPGSRNEESDVGGRQVCAGQRIPGSRNEESDVGGRQV